MARSTQAALLLIILIFLGTYLRTSNISANKLYPDAYQNLLVAKNIIEYHNVAGFLGPEGMLYPQYVAWSRFGYPLLINAAGIVIKDETSAAQWVSLALGILSIPAAYLLIKRVFVFSGAGLCASFLLAVSFNHIVWGGFILTETTGVFLILLFLTFLFAHLKKHPAWAELIDILSGIVFAAAVATRYEYLLLIIPVTFLIFKESPKPFIKITNIYLTALITLSFSVIQLFPIQSAIFTFREQVKDQLVLGMKIVGLSIISFILISRIPHTFKQKFQDLVLNLYLVSTMIIAVLFLVNVITLKAGISLPFRFSGMTNFFLYDFLLGLFFIIGSFSMFKDNRFKSLLLFSYISMTVLGASYYQINPDMQRYGTHLIPFILIPASYGLYSSLNYLSQKKIYLRTLLLAMIISAFIVQIILSYKGLKGWRNGEWFQKSYEEASAEKLKDVVKEDNALVITALPDAYYYFVRKNTYGIADKAPFIDIPESLDNNEVYVVSDLAMNYYFQEFSQFLASQKDKYHIVSYDVGEAFHVESRSYAEKKPILIYKATLGDLKNRIQGARLP